MVKRDADATRTAEELPRVLLMFEAPGDRRVISAWLEGRYFVHTAEGPEALESDFDVCILDDANYARVWSLISERRRASEPCFLPFVLLTAEKSRRSMWAMPAHEVDDVLEAPTPPDVVVARLEVLVERRRREQALTAEKHRATAALAESEARLRALHESLRDGFVQTSMDGIIVDTNEAFREMVGYSEEELRHLTYRDLTPDPWHELEQRIVEEQIIPSGYSAVYEKEYRRKDGSIIPIELRTFLLRGADGSPESMWATVRDISERKRHEDELQEALEAARSSEARLQDAIGNIDRARRHEERARARAEALLVAATAIASGLTLSEVLDAVCNVVLMSCSHSRASVSLLDEVSGQVRVAASQGYSPMPVGLTLAQDDLTAPARRILEDRTPGCVDYDAITSPHKPAGEVAARLSFVVPLTYRGGVLGLLIVDDPGERGEFDTFEREFFEAVGAQAAVAIENARLYEFERESHRLAAGVAETRASVVSRDGPELPLTGVLQQAVELLRASAGALISGYESEIEHRDRAGALELFDRPDIDRAIRAAVAGLADERAADRPPRVDCTDVRGESGETISLAVTLTSDVECCSAIVFARESEQFRPHEAEFVRQVSVTIGLATQEERVRREREWLSSARQEWLSGISHDLRTPLATIRGYAMLLADERGTPPEEVKRQADIIVGQTQRIQSLVADMLLMFQIREGRLPVVLERTDLVALLDDLQQSLRLDPRLQGRTLVFDAPVTPRWAEVDGRLLERAVQNVATNAIVHNPEGTTIRLSLSATDGWEEIVVSDDGLGMDDATLSRVWARYERATGAGSDTDGVGLGMSITRQLVERMGGVVVVESSPGAGTTVCMRMPRWGGARM